MSPTTIQNIESGKVKQRTYLTSNEVDRLIEGAATTGRYPKRDALIISMLFRHGLRSVELTDLRWDHVQFDRAMLHVERAKNSDDSRQPIKGDELRQLRAMKNKSKTIFVFTTERGEQMSTRNVRAIVARAAAKANLDVNVHAHMLRHACGFHLANNGTPTRTIQSYLGHKNIMHTVIYTKLSDSAFKGIEKQF